MSDLPPSFPPKEPVPRHAKPEKKGGWLRETALVVVVALTLSVIIKTFFAQAFYIPSASMENTLNVGDRIMVNKLADDADSLRRGDVVVFVDPGGWLSESPEEPGPVMGVITGVLSFIGILPPNAGEHVIKRVIGMPGDHVLCCGDDGRLTVNDVPIDEYYLKPGVEPSETAFDVIVPDGQLWLLGDNRANSRDSRAHLGAPGGGFVPIDHVEGRAFVVTWPLDSLGGLGGGHEAFDDIP